VVGEGLLRRTEILVVKFYELVALNVVRTSRMRMNHEKDEFARGRYRVLFLSLTASLPQGLWFPVLFRNSSVVSNLKPVRTMELSMVVLERVFLSRRISSATLLLYVLRWDPVLGKAKAKKQDRDFGLCSGFFWKCHRVVQRSLVGA